MFKTSLGKLVKVKPSIQRLVELGNDKKLSYVASRKVDDFVRNTKSYYKDYIENLEYFAKTFGELISEDELKKITDKEELKDYQMINGNVYKINKKEKFKNHVDKLESYEPVEILNFVEFTDKDFEDTVGLEIRHINNLYEHGFLLKLMRESEDDYKPKKIKINIEKEKKKNQKEVSENKTG